MTEYVLDVFRTTAAGLENLAEDDLGQTQNSEAPLVFPFFAQDSATTE
jgi:hypothetical protein